MSPKNIAPAAVSIAERALNVFDIQTRETFTVNVKDTDTIESVKVKIQDVKSWPIESMTIRAGGRILKDEKVINEKPLVELARDAPAPPAPEPGELPSAEWLNYHTLPQLVVMLTERGISGGRRTKAEAVKKLLAQWFPPSSAVVINLKVSDTKTVKLHVMAGDTINIQDYLESDNDNEVEDKDEETANQQDAGDPETAATSEDKEEEQVPMINIFVKLPNGIHTDIECASFDTVATLKSILQKFTGLKPKKQSLKYAGKSLADDDVRLCDVPLMNGSSVTVEVARS